MVFTILSYIFKERLYQFIVLPLQNLDVKLIHLKVYDKFMAFLKISLYSGIILSFPIILYQLSLFILPALYPSERKWYYTGLSGVVVLFFIGTFFAYRIMTPISLEFLINFGKENPPISINSKAKKKNKDALTKELLSINNNLSSSNKNLRELIIKGNTNNNMVEVNKNFALIYKDFLELNKKINKLWTKSNKNAIESTLSISDYIDWLLFFIFMVGVVFQLPLVLTILARIGIVNARSLSRFRPYAVIIILVVGAVITPPDWITQLMIGVPVYLLYEVSILMARLMQRYKEKAEKEETV